MLIEYSIVVYRAVSVSLCVCVSGLGLAPLFVQRCTLIRFERCCCRSCCCCKIYMYIYKYIYIYIYVYLCVSMCALRIILRSILYKCRRTTGSSLSIMFIVSEPLRSLPDARFPDRERFINSREIHFHFINQLSTNRFHYIRRYFPLSMHDARDFALYVEWWWHAEEKMRKKKGEDGRKLCPWGSVRKFSRGGLSKFY